MKQDETVDVLNQIKKFKSGTKLLILVPIKSDLNRSIADKLKIFTQQGYARVLYNGDIVRIEDLKGIPQKNIELVIDRLIVRHEQDFYNRTADAIEIAFYEGLSLIHI